MVISVSKSANPAACADPGLIRNIEPWAVEVQAKPPQPCDLWVETELWPGEIE
jgi:hypothetical protein